ncbi:hypothetical protein B0H63DRAFT_31391 [Podospora didyma]|uniref:N-terminal of MaoC-like dehydratase domain-containing protein n=1 Tax=Podospora didyma TaxID=330526 RepID=A0AAE0P637_9PEZI|nr:hypothetical protein B0H63DRAFT_31391 [Podospora didyma]
MSRTFPARSLGRQWLLVASPQTWTTPRSTSQRRSIADAWDCAKLLNDRLAGRVTYRREVLDGNQLQKLYATLGRKWETAGPRQKAIPNGFNIPPGYHLIYFTPYGFEDVLGRDGSDTQFNAPWPYTRRMWAGGKMTWQRPHVANLQVGEEVEERTWMVRATAKRSASDGDWMVVVDLEKEYWGRRGLAMTEQRSWIFKKPVSSLKLAGLKADWAAIEEAHAKEAETVLHPLGQKSGIQDMMPDDGGEYLERHLKWSPVALFRFSALTFNAHMIHYNESWTREVEGHPGPVVHGPLNLINMMDYWRDVHGTPEQLWPKEVTYRATAPIYAGEMYKFKTIAYTSESGLGPKDGARYVLRAQKNGIDCMLGEVVAHISKKTYDALSPFKNQYKQAAQQQAAEE